MFFVFGSPRSGTTLLAQCLSSHRDIIIPNETDLIIPLAFIFDRIKNPQTGREIIAKMISESACYPNSVGEFVSVGEINEIVHSCDYHPAAIINALYGKIAEKAGKKLAGDKSPNDLLFLRMLIKNKGISTDMKIIHIVRDIRDIMESLNRIKMGGNDLDLYFPRFWTNSNLYLHSLYKNKKKQYLLVRYEDFVKEPEARLKKIASFLGVDYQDEMLNPSNRHSRYKAMPHHSHLFQPISTERINLHKTIKPARIKAYETQAREAMDVFGYSKGSASDNRIKRLVKKFLPSSR